MAKRFRYDVLESNISYWANASHWAKGYNVAKGLKWNDKGSAGCYLYSDMHDGYIKGGCGNHFCVAIKVELTQQERDEIDEISRQKKLKEAKKELELAAKRVEELSLS